MALSSGVSAIGPVLPPTQSGRLGEDWPASERSLVMTAVLLGGQVGHPGQRLANRLALVTAPSVPPDRDVEVPGPADFDHVELADQARREGLVVGLTLHDAPYRFVDGRHAAFANEGHRLHRSIASYGHRHQGIGVRLFGGPPARPRNHPIKPQQAPSAVPAAH